MKTIILTVFFGMFFCVGFSQEKTIKKHVIDSQSIEGVWQMAGELKMGDKMSYVPIDYSL